MRHAPEAAGAKRDLDTPFIPDWVRQVGQNMRVDVVTAEVVQALRADGIRSILLKGPATVRLLFGEEVPRPYGDVDLLVRPDAPAEEVLRRLGFVREVELVVHDWPELGVVWSRESDGAVVDLHRSFFGIGVERREAWTVLTERTESIEVGGVGVEVLRVPARALVIGLHAAAHGRGFPKALDDLHRAMAQLGLEVWSETARLAEQLKASSALASGLRILPEGQQLADQLGLPKRTSAELVIRASGEPKLSLAYERLARLQGIRVRAMYVFAKLMPPESVLRSWGKMYAPGTLNLTELYLRRVTRLARRFIPAYLAWRRAKKSG